MGLVSVTIPISLLHSNALFHNLCKHNPHIYPDLCLFVVLETYPSEILLVTEHLGPHSQWHAFNTQ